MSGGSLDAELLLRRLTRHSEERNEVEAVLRAALRLSSCRFFGDRISPIIASPQLRRLGNGEEVYEKNYEHVNDRPVVVRILRQCAFENVL